MFDDKVTTNRIDLETTETGYNNNRIRNIENMRKRLDERVLQDSKARLNLFSETAGRLLTCTDPEEIISNLFKKLSIHLGLDIYLNYIMEQDGNTLALSSFGGAQANAFSSIQTLNLGQGVSGCVARDCCRIVAESIQAPAGNRSNTELGCVQGLQAYVCYPLIAHGRLLGTMSFGTKRKATFATDELALLQTACDFIALSLERVNLIGKVEEGLAFTDIEIDLEKEQIDSEKVALRAIFEQLSHGIIYLDHELQVRQVNGYALEFMKRNEEQLVGTVIHEQLSETFDLNIAQSLIDGINDVLTNGETIDLIGLNFKHVDTWEQSHYVDLSISRLEDSSGEPCGLILTFVDVTNRVTNQKAMEECDSRFRIIFENSAIGMVLGTVDGTILECNSAYHKMLGYESGKMEHRKFSDFTYPEDEAMTLDFIADLVEGKRDNFYQEKRYIRKDGTVVWGHLTASLLRDAEGRAKYVIGVVNDITERRQAEEKNRHQLEELRRWHGVILDREDRVQELKSEVNTLLQRLSEPFRYSSQSD